ncbi:hypothetical protein [Bradyrhizobium sp. 141]|uniref:hypothetical protein n=1 Tax=Bradyrhizobium sp. 141 TaxID=2782617 RepID=UPI001FF8AA9F|nr:hypothetical protein [Bradyrhizobium sp. 141]
MRIFPLDLDRIKRGIEAICDEAHARVLASHRIEFRPCFQAHRLYLSRMELSDIQDFAIQARLAAVLGASEFDRVFTGVRFAEIEGPLLYVYAKDEAAAAAIEEDFALLVGDIASRILKQDIDVVIVLPKVLQ